jgi:hypothetical protein
MSKDGGSSGDDWMSKLMGKKLGEQHDEMVRGVLILLPFYLHLLLPFTPHPLTPLILLVYL